MKRDTRHILTGFAAGLISALILFFVLQGVDFEGIAPAGGAVAQIDGKSLSERELSRLAGETLIPLESDRYALLKNAAEQWLNDALLEKARKEEGLSATEFQYRHFWEKVTLTEADVYQHYQNNKNVYGKPFDEVKVALYQTLRKAEYENIRQNVLRELKTKYHGQIFLEEPEYLLPSAVVDEPKPFKTADSPIKVGAPSQRAAAEEYAGQPVQGNVNGPVTLVEVSDFHCSFCQKAEATVGQLMKAYPGKIKRVWMHFPLPFHQNARIVHEASECAAEQGKFWEFHDKVFQDPQKYKDEASLLAAGDELGLKKDAYRTCVQTKKYGGKIDANITKAKSMGVSGTPAFFINGAMISGAQPYEQFKAAVDRALDPSIPPPSAPAPAAPAKAQFQDLDSRPSQGPKNAPVTVIEVSDFHCPFCGKVKPALDQLMKDYNGKIRLVWMHYPLPMHKNARLVHEASECAAEQGKFWEFKEKVFANQQAYQDEASLKSLAKEIGLKEKNFSECVSTSRYKDKIEKDIKAAGSAGVNGTPSFFINGVILTGARPYDQFKAAVDNALNPGSAPPPAAAPARPKARPVTEEDIRGRPATGPDKASVTLIEVSDFHCPFCQRAVATLDQVMQKYEGKVRHIWLHFPLPFHKDAFRVHEAAECAARQGKFWEYKAKIFADSNQYKTDDALKALAAELKLKANDFSKCLESGQAKAAVEKDMETAASLGVSGTPSFLINGELLVGAKPLEEFSRVIDQKLNQ